MILLPIFFIAFIVIINLAVHKMLFIYKEYDKAGFPLKMRTWGPSFSDTKKVYNLTSDKNIKIKARISLNLWKMGFYYLICFLILFVIVIRLNNK